MAKVFIQEDTLQGIADAIRGKNGSSDTYTPLQMATAIQNLSGGGSASVGYRLPYGNLYVPDNITCTLNITLSGELPVYLYYTDVNRESTSTTLSLGLNTFSLCPYSWFILYYPNDNGQSGWISNLTITPNSSFIKTIDISYGGIIIPFSDQYFGIRTTTMLIPTDPQYSSSSAPSQTISMNLHTSSATCFLKGTKITLADGTYKNCEDITFDDELLVWDFDNGCFVSAKPMFIKKPETTNKYVKLTFNDGTCVCYTGHRGYHRIFNEQAGMFTSTKLPETPIGTITFKDDSSRPKLISKEIVNENCEYYNIITDRHYNCFTNGILSSCKISNTHPIIDMKYTDSVSLDETFVKEYLEKIKNNPIWIKK